MDPKVLIEAEKRLKQDPGFPSRMLKISSKSGDFFTKARSWMKPEKINSPKKSKKSRVTKSILDSAMESVDKELLSRCRPVCPRDTNGDGDCGRRNCQICYPVKKTVCETCGVKNTRWCRSCEKYHEKRN